MSFAFNPARHSGREEWRCSKKYAIGGSKIVSTSESAASQQASKECKASLPFDEEYQVQLLTVAIHSYDTIAQHSSNDTAFQANEKNAAFDSSLSSKTRKNMLIEHDSIVKCTDVSNHKEEDSGNNNNRGTTNEDNNDSWNINNSDSSDIGSVYETNDDEKVTHGVAEIIERAFNAALSARYNLENPTRPARCIGQSKRTQRRKNAAFKRAAVGTKPLTAYFIKQMAEHEQEGEEDSQQDDSAESSDSNENTSNWTDAKRSASIEKVKAMKGKGKASQAAQIEMTR
uniref:AlNc14C666G12365 protein n=1 Tax=Albugo laibachii Nc14 TaxID=890382 RepID=F0X1Q1_9STRA|nr:AlNc14C666G12365 [Albugo laibachii Nc14]|eukprot:CCA27749.1 AlNc14C666G12365 [Albugo laibachii Nc14]